MHLVYFIFGISYAYFSLNIIGNEDAKLSVITAGTLELTYTDGSGDVILENVIPGSSIQKEITVKNTGTIDTTYNLVWGQLINEFENNEIVLSATCERLNSEGTIDGTCNNIEEKAIINNIIQKNISIESGITHKYTITITFIETGENQNYNQGKGFAGIININEDSDIAGTLKKDYFEETGMTDRASIKSISFYSDNRVIEGANKYDVSEEQNSSVLMYVKQNSDNNSLYDLSIVADGKIAFPEDSSGLLESAFYTGCYGYVSNLSSIEFNNSVDTHNVTNMSSMFFYSQATTLDLSSFDTRNVTDMNSMFSNSKATTLDLSNFNTHNVTSMRYMFYYSQATTLDLSNFDTSNVTDMSGMFYDSQATAVDLSNFDTRNVTNMSYMFADCQVTELDLKNFNTSNVTDMRVMFGNSVLTTLDLSNFDTSNVTNMNYMFQKSNNLKTIYTSNKFATASVTSSTNMFNGCTNLVGGQGTIYDSTKIDKTYARIDGGTSNPGYFTSKN